MREQFSPLVFGIVVSSLVAASAALVGCRAAPEVAPDDAPQERVQEGVSEAGGLVSTSDLSSLLPARTAGVVALRGGEMDKASTQLPLLEPLFAPVWGPDPLLPALRHAMLHGADYGLDEARPVLVALGVGGSDDFYDKVRAAAPLENLGVLPDHVHVRMILPATDMDRLEEGLRGACEERGAGECREFSAVGRAAVGGVGYVTVDVVLGASERGFWEPKLEAERWRMATAEGGLTGSAAWQRLMDGGDALSLYIPLQRLADPMLFLTALRLEQWMALMEIRGEAVPVTGDAELVGVISMALTAQSLFDLTEMTELSDVTTGLSVVEGVLLVDAVAGLTEYGMTLREVLDRDAELSRGALGQPAVEVEWAFDLREAVRKAAYPTAVAQAVAGTDASGEHQRVLLNEFYQTARQLHPLSVLAFVLRSPVTSFVLFQELSAGQTTPSEFSRIQGMYAGLEVPEAGQELLTALALALQGDEEDPSYEEFASAALLPFGAGARSRRLPVTGGVQVQTTTGRPVAEAFGEEAEPVASGVTASMNLPRMRALYQALGGTARRGIDPMDPGSLLEVALPVTAFLPPAMQDVYFRMHFGDAQVVHRLQMGGAPTTALPQMPAAAVMPDRVGPACLVQAGIWALTVESGMPGEGIAEYLREAGADLAVLAEDCDDEQEAERLRQSAAAWQEFLLGESE